MHGRQDEKTLCTYSVLAILVFFLLPGVASSALSPPNHVTCYQLAKPQKFAGVQIALGDHFWSSTSAVVKSTRICVPTRKNSNPPPSAPTEHLEMYQLKPLQKFAKVLDLVFTDSFGTLHLDVLKPAEIMLPTATSSITFPPIFTPVNDHFRCYKVKDRKVPAKFAPVVVTLTDQFQALQVEVKKPTRLCAPVNKNDEDPPASSHPDHLVCYQVKDLKQPAFAPAGPMFTTNQFGQYTVDAKKPVELCVPALQNP